MNRHEELIRSTLLRDIQEDINKRLAWKGLPGSNRVALSIEKFTAKFMATCEATQDGMEILKEYPFFAVQLVIAISIDGIAIDPHRVEFSKRCLSDPIYHEEVVEGTGGNLFTVIEPVLTYGWCKSCDLAYKWSTDFAAIVCPKCGVRPQLG